MRVKPAFEQRYKKRDLNWHKESFRNDPPKKNWEIVYPTVLKPFLNRITYTVSNQCEKQHENLNFPIYKKLSFQNPIKTEIDGF